MNHHNSNINHLKLSKNTFDPYNLIINRINRLSLSIKKNNNKYINKKELIKWLYLLQGYSEELCKLIVLEGIINNKFHSISFILNLLHHNELKEMNSKNFYKFLHNLIETAPEGILGWIDYTDFSVTKNVISLLNNSGNDE